MRKLYIFIIILLFPLIAISQTAAIALIKKANSTHSNIICHFSQQRHTISLNKVETLEGTLYYSATDRMSMHYTNPPTDLLVINSDQFYMVSGKRKKFFNLTQNASISSLAHLLLNSMNGDMKAIQQETGAILKYTEDANYHIFTFTQTKQQRRGYRSITLKYAKSDLLLHFMRLEEFSGNYNTYTLTNHNFKIPSSDKYKIPKSKLSLIFS